MSFLNPLFWLAAVTVAIPVLLHLTRRDVLRPIPVPSLMFLRRVPFHETRRRQIRNWLLLLLRCAVLLLLVAAFARPVAGDWFSTVNPDARRSTVILLDRSLSMARPNVWSQALEEAAAEVSSRRQGDELCLVAFDARSEVLVRWTARGEEILQVLSSGLSPGYDSTSFAEGIRQALAQLETATGERRRIVLISDLQAAGLDLERLRDEPAGGVELEVRDVGRPEANLYIEQISVPREVFGTRTSLTVRIRAWVPEGHTPPADRGEIRLYLEDRLVDRRDVSLVAGAATVQFDAVEVPEGISRGRLVLAPGGALTADDVRYFVMERAQPFQVALLSRGEDPGFFEAALESGTNLPFQLRRVSTLAELETAALVVLIEDGLQSDPRGLKALLERGGGVIIAAGNRTAAPVPGGWTDLMPGRLLEKRFASARSFQTITELNRDHPALAPLTRGNQNLLSPVQFYGYWAVEPSAEAALLARLGDGSPLLLERPAGGGRVLLYASSLDRVWSDFPVRAAFLPFWQSVIQYASGWNPRPPEHLIGTGVSLAALAGSQAAPAGRDVLDPAGRRLTTLGEEAPTALHFALPGYYELRYERQTDWMASNPDPVESNLDRVSAADLEVAFNRLRARERAATAEAASAAAPIEPIGWLLLWAALGLLVAETLAANRRGRDGRPAVTAGHGDGVG